MRGMDSNLRSGLRRSAAAGWLTLCVVVLAAAKQNPPACRDYAAASNRSGVGAASETCGFDAATNRFTCILNLASNRVVSMRQYASKADFVDEIRLIPPISRAQSGTTTYSASGPGAQNATLTFAYDGQRRQTELSFRFADGRVIKGVYTQWDASGRPTLMTNAGQTLKYSYDDAKRTMTIVNATSGGSQVHTFDANGSLVREDIVSPAGAAAATIVKINKTAQVCR